MLRLLSHPRRPPRGGWRQQERDSQEPHWRKVTALTFLVKVHLMHLRGLFDTAQEAAIAYAQLKEDIELGMPLPKRRETQPSPATAAAPKERRVGIFLGELLRQQRTLVPIVACALLSQQQAAAAAARGVAVAYAECIA